MVIRRVNLRSLSHAIVGFAALLVCGMAAADPPARVARLANIGGAVSFSPAGEDEWVFAIPNRPLITGDRVWADAGARAELQIGSLALRIGSQTSVTILNLDDRVAQFQLAQGALNVRVRRIDPGQTIEVDTPLLAFSLRRPGDYRIDVDPASGATTVAVRSGEGEVYGEGAAYVIAARQWYRFADSGLRDYQYDALPPADAFDSWTRDRDRRQDNPVAARYVSPDVIGYADLDEYGTWSSVEGYGNVWVPTSVARDWAPYRDGHWSWIEPWGWTWVDDAPWGFAPFHYGRWAYARERWCWVPGPVRTRAVYAPALVAFVGGNNFRVSVGSGGPARGIAWFPLAPGEVYRPAYRVSRNYFTNVNISNTNVSNTYVTNVYNRPDTQTAVYRNRDQRGGMTAVPTDVFVQSRPVARSAVAVSRDVAATAQVTPVAAIAPVRASVIGGGERGTTGGAPAAGPGTVSRPPMAAIQRPVIARVAPPPPPASFTTREATLAKDPGRPADPATVVAPRGPVNAAQAAPAVKVVAPATPGTPPPAPTVSRPRTNAPPAAAGGPPAGGGGAPPGSGAAPPPAVAPPGMPLPRPGVAVPTPPAPGAPSPVQTRPPSPGPVPRADIPPTSAPASPAAGRVPPSPPQPAPAQDTPQPPKATEMRPVPQPPPAVARPPAPAPAPAELRREAQPPPPVVNRPPVAPSQPPAELRREPPPAAPAAAKPPAAPSPPPAELRREPPAPPPAAVKLPPPPSPPPAELRREPPPAPAPAAAKPPAAPLPPPAELRREPPPPPVVAKPPAVQAPPAAAPPAPPARVREPEPKAKAEPAKGEAPKGKPEEKREDQK
jgi:hypothetical protein